MQSDKPQPEFDHRGRRMSAEIRTTATPQRIERAMEPAVERLAAILAKQR